MPAIIRPRSTNGGSGWVLRTPQATVTASEILDAADQVKSQDGLFHGEEEDSP